MIFRICVFLVALGSWMMVVNSGDLTSDFSLNEAEDSPISSSLSVEQPATEQRSRRLKRSSWSLPPNTSVRYQLDWIIPIAPLNNTFTLMIYDLIFRFVLPTYIDLQSLYDTIGKISLDEKEDEGKNVIDLEFLEEQRANHERHNVYLHVEDIFKKMGYDGHTCLLRAMCELAETPLAHHGLLGKMLDLVFSPSLMKVPKTMEPYMNGNRIRRDLSSIPELEVLQHPLENDYTEAYKAGKEGKCWMKYYSCPISVFTMLFPFGG